jgi:hypothetical protein
VSAPDLDPEPVHGWFSLTYSSYLVLHRSVMQAMPVEWQRRMVALLNEMEEAVDTSKLPSKFMVRARAGGRFIEDPFRNYRHPPAIPMRAANGGSK